MIRAVVAALAASLLLIVGAMAAPARMPDWGALLQPVIDCGTLRGRGILSLEGLGVRISIECPAPVDV